MTSGQIRAQEDPPLMLATHAAQPRHGRSCGMRSRTRRTRFLRSRNTHRTSCCLERRSCTAQRQGCKRCCRSTQKTRRIRSTKPSRPSSPSSGSQRLLHRHLRPPLPEQSRLQRHLPPQGDPRRRRARQEGRASASIKTMGWDDFWQGTVRQKVSCGCQTSDASPGRGSPWPPLRRDAAGAYPAQGLLHHTPAQRISR